MVDRNIEKKVIEFVSELRRNRIKVTKVIIYGSQVTGKARKFSDIDVAVISPDFGKGSRDAGARLFEIAARIDPRIEPVAFSPEEYRKDTWVPLIYEIRTKGVELKAA
jgi:predicted nucleotidyltransferase